jgi:hypothetical protein
MNYRRSNFHHTAAIAGLILISLTGCKYDRSFMNMDSNSGSPFFGLQLAVDSGSRPPGPDEESKKSHRSVSPSDRLEAMPVRRKPGSESQPPMQFTRTATAGRRGLEHTSELRDLNTNVRYSLQSPVTDESLQTQTIDLRLSSF